MGVPTGLVPFLLQRTRIPKGQKSLLTHKVSITKGFDNADANYLGRRSGRLSNSVLRTRLATSGY